MSELGLLTQIVEVLFALLAAPAFLGWVNQCRAWLQNRRAPSLLLPYRQLQKLFCKDAILAENSSSLFRVAPYIVFGTMVAAAAIIPSMGTGLPLSRAADGIALVGLLATGRVFLSLAAMDIGTAFGSLGARREMMVGFLAEPALLMVFFVAALLSRSQVSRLCCRGRTWSWGTRWRRLACCNSSSTGSQKTGRRARSRISGERIK